MRSRSWWLPLLNACRECNWLPCWWPRSQQRWIAGIHCMQATKHTSEGSTLALKPRGDITRGTVAPQKGLMSSKKLKKKEITHYETDVSPAQLIMSPKLKHKIDRYVNIVNVVLFMKPWLSKSKLMLFLDYSVQCLINITIRVFNSHPELAICQYWRQRFYYVKTKISSNKMLPQGYWAVDFSHSGLILPLRAIKWCATWDVLNHLEYDNIKILDIPMNK